MGGREQGEPGLSIRACSAALVVAGLLLFCWPFVRSPSLGLAGSYLHLLGSWTLVIAGIALMARALRRRGVDADE